MRQLGRWREEDHASVSIISAAGPFSPKTALALRRLCTYGQLAGEEEAYND